MVAVGDLLVHSVGSLLERTRYTAEMSDHLGRDEEKQDVRYLLLP